MGDVVLRDHNQPCEHGFNGLHSISDGGDVWWCSGGRELEATEMDWCSKHKSLWLWSTDHCEALAAHDWDAECVVSTVLIAEVPDDD